MTIQNPLKGKQASHFIALVTKDINLPKQFKLDGISTEDGRFQILLKREYHPVAFHQTRKQFHENMLCLYDGIKLRSYDREYIEWLISHERFKFQITIDSRTKMPLRYKGAYEYDQTDPKNKKKFDIDIHLVPDHDGWAVDFSGSVHNWSNKGHNYNDFYWPDFLKVYADMISVFKFNPDEMEVVNLEVGVNCIIPAWMKVTVPEILESILSLLGVCKNKSWIQESDRNTYKVERGERYLKAYYKSLQYKLKQQILRLELGYPRSRRLIKDAGVAVFSDLTKISTLIRFKELLEQAFENFHTYQPELSNIPTSEIEADSEIAKYVIPSFWCKLKKMDRRKYAKARKNQERLISKYCSYNLSKDIRRMLHEKLW